MKANDAMIRCLESEVMMPVSRRGQARSTEMSLTKVLMFCVKTKYGDMVAGSPDGSVEELLKVAMKKIPLPSPPPAETGDAGEPLISGGVADAQPVPAEAVTDYEEEL